MKPNYNNVSLKISAVKKTQFLNDLPQIVFCGRSNVGKSSMINCLLRRKSLARTSAKPGKTATINYFEIDKKVYLELWVRVKDDWRNSERMMKNFGYDSKM